MRSYTDPQAVVSQLQAVLESPDSFQSHHHEIIHLARRAIAALESPFEAFQRLVFSPSPLFAAHIGEQHNIFQILVDDAKNGQPFTTSAALAERTGLQQPVLETLLEYMATQSFVERVSAEEFKPTLLTSELLTPLFMDGIMHFLDNCLPALAALGSFLSNPAGARTAFELGHHTSDGFYEWMETHPANQGAFHRFMQIQFASLPTWLDVVDFQTEFAQDADPATPIFVDIGGSNGQQCTALLQKNPDITGRVILQDLPSVVAKAISDDRVEKMGYDYFTEQPVKNARAYYFRQIFHNNDDKNCLRILRSLCQAIGPSSVLLIDEKVLDDQKTYNSEYTASLSLMMLAMFNTLERRERQWRALLGEAGLQIKEIRPFTSFGDCVIIAIKP